MHFFSSLFGGLLAVFMALGGLLGVHQSVQPTVSAATRSLYQSSADSHASSSQTTVEATATATGGPSKANENSVTQVAKSDTSSSTVQDHTKGTSTIDPRTIPLGDGKVSTEPKIGYVYSCQQIFNGRGASHDGGWIDQDTGTWDATAKLQVQGKNLWDNAFFSNIVSGALRLLAGNGLPVDEPTGNFPIAQADPAYAIDRNPNSIATQNISYQLPSNPVFAAKPSCVPMGAIGVALDGVAIFNALDAAGRDAVAHEVQDLCDGHPESSDEYHYHGPSVCMPHVNDIDTVVGYALDGFPITSLYAANGKKYDDADLDACHGMTSAISIDGTVKTMYHYVLTQEYPYTIGCFMGTPLHIHNEDQVLQQKSDQTSQPANTTLTDGQAPQGQQPPQIAITACEGKTANAACSMQTQKGSVSGSCRTTPDGSFACVPN